MKTTLELLEDFLQIYPFQPATAIWRTFELETLLNNCDIRGDCLDLGCGDGKFTQLLEKRMDGTRHWVGVDTDPLEIAMAQASAIYSQLVIPGGENLPFPSNNFDVVFSNSVLEHVDNISPILHEVSRVLRPDGKFIFTVPSENFHNCLAGPLLPFSNRDKYLDSLDRRCAHIRYWGESEWGQHLASAGMKIVSRRPYLTISETQKWENWSRLTGGILFHLFSQKIRPIEIQRKFKVRNSDFRMPISIAKLLSRILMPPRRVNSNENSCLLIVASKKEI